MYIPREIANGELSNISENDTERNTCLRSALDSAININDGHLIFPSCLKAMMGVVHDF